MDIKNLEVGKEIDIYSEKFTVEKIIKNTSVIGHNNQVEFLTYKLNPKNKKITRANLNYFKNDKIVFGINKIVDFSLDDSKIKIENEIYDVQSIDEEFYIDKNGSMQDNVCYKLLNQNPNVVLIELHVIPDKKNILYIESIIKEEDVKND